MSQQQLLEDLRATLIDDAAIAALVAPRIWLNQAPQDGALPCIVYQPVSQQHGYKLAGTDGLRTIRVQIDLYSQVASETITLFERVLDLLDGQAQTLNSRTEVLGCFLENADTTYEAGQRVYRQQIDLNITYRQTI